MQCANKLGIYKFPDLVEYSLGKTYRKVFEVFTVFLSISFTIAPLAFFMRSLRSVVYVTSGVEVDMWVFLVSALVVFAPLAWIRSIEMFSPGYMIAVAIIFSMIILVSTIDFMEISDRNGEAGPGWEAFNPHGAITMLGLSFYLFDRVGSLLPIMEASEFKDNFVVLLCCALATLLTINIYFSELCYYNFGSTIKETIVIFQLPQANIAVIIGNILFCINIILSYPLVIYPANLIIEKAVFGKMTYSPLRTWLKNFSRTLVLLSALVVAYLFYYNLSKILSLTSVVLGSFVVLITPLLVHFKMPGVSRC